MKARTRTLTQIHQREDDQLSACIKQGRAAYREGKPITACPHRGYSWRQCWELGWTREKEADAARWKCLTKETR